jgi:hypothetical protein
MECALQRGRQSPLWADAVTSGTWRLMTGVANCLPITPGWNYLLRANDSD